MHSPKMTTLMDLNRRHHSIVYKSSQNERKECRGERRRKTEKPTRDSAERVEGKRDSVKAL